MKLLLCFILILTNVIGYMCAWSAIRERNKQAVQLIMDDVQIQSFRDKNEKLQHERDSLVWLTKTYNWH